MVVGVAFWRSALDVVIVLLADVKLASDDGLDAFLLCRVDKMHGAKNIAVIGHGDGRHPELFHAMDELFDVAGAVKERVIGMEMQVDELIAHFYPPILAAWRGCATPENGAIPSRW